MTVEKTMTVAQVREKSRIKKLLPTRDDFRGKAGYREFEKPLADGSTWEYRWTPNDGHGRPTRETGMVGEAMKEFQRADTARHVANQSATPRAAMRDANGAVQYVDAAFADGAARQNGWGHVWRPRGASVERGVDGMMWRLLGGAWTPTGRWCLGTPATQSSRPPAGKRDGTIKTNTMQRDPDGEPWRWINGEWRTL